MPFKISKDANIWMKNGVDEIAPAITDGLISHFPFEGTAKSIAPNNQLDYSKWVVGTSGTQGMFNCNGAVSENFIIESQDPFGNTVPIWEARSDAASDADGGWDTTVFNIDNTKTYRFSVWIKRSVIGDGYTYHGINGFNSATSNVGVLNMSGAVDTNPYFFATTWSLAANQWYLFVGHVHPVGYTGSTHPESGVYNLQGTKVANCADFKWQSTSVKANQRSYLYYSVNTATRQQFCYPKAEVIDGTHATLQDLLEGLPHAYLTPVAMNTNTTLTTEGVAVSEATTNVVFNTPSNPNTWSGKRGNSTVVDPYFANCEILPYGVLAYKQDKNVAPSTWSGNAYSYTHIANPTCAIGDEYTCSVYCYMSPDCNLTWAMINTEAAGGGSSNYDVSKKGTWQRLVFTVKATAAGALNTYLYICKEGVTDFSTMTGYVLYCAPQVQKQCYATFFTDGTRAKGQLRIPVNNVNLDTTPFTLVLKARPLNNLSWLGQKSQEYYAHTYQWGGLAYFEHTVGGRVDFWWGRTSSGESTSTVEFLNGDGAGGGWIGAGPRSARTIDDITIAIVFSGGFTTYLYVVLNGTLYSNTNTRTGNIGTCSGIFLDGCLNTYLASNIIKSASTYKRALSANEIRQLAASPLSVRPTKKASIKSIVEGNSTLKLYPTRIQAKEIVEDNEGWRLVYYGTTMNSFEHNTRTPYYRTWGDEITFTQMKIKCPYFEYEVTGTLNKTAKMKLSFQQYVDWLFAQPDANSPRMMFHGLNDVQDAAFTSPTALLYGYGNSWRCITPWHYLTEYQMYQGSVDRNVLKPADWGAPNENYIVEAFMNKDDIRETGKYRLTPLEYQTIQVWVK